MTKLRPFDFEKRGKKWLGPSDQVDVVVGGGGGGGGGGSGAPTDAQYLVSASHAGLSAERVATNTPSISWDFGTAGQAKANAVAGASGPWVNANVHYGAVGDDSTLNDTAIADAEAAGLPYFFEPGIYRVSTGVVQMVNVRGSGAGITFIKATAGLVGRTWTMDGGQYPISLEDITILSSRTIANEPYNQVGLFDKGTVGNYVHNIRIQGFDDKCLEVGDPSIGAGSYYATYQNIRIFLINGQTGNYGVYINGPATDLNSNDSTWINVSVANRFSRPYYIGGNNHIFIAGGAEGQDGSVVQQVYEIDGSNNEIRRPYIEYGVTSPKLVTFTAASKNNEIKAVFPTYVPSGPAESYVTDLGANNRVSLSENIIGTGFTHESVADEWSPNLFMNSGFKFWRSATAPWGFTNTTGASQDTGTTVDGVASSMKITLAANVVSATCFVDDTVGAPTTHFQYPLSMFAGKEVFWQAKCKTSIADAGVLISVTSPSGNQNISSGICHHTQNGEWQTLNVLGSIKADATGMTISLTSSVTGTNHTGDLWWAAPVLKVRQAKWKESVQSDRPVFTNPTVYIPGATALRGFTVPDADDQLVGRTVAQTLTNKTLTTPSIGGPETWDELGADPSTPASTFWKLYFKAAGLFYKDDAGTVIGPLAAAGAGAFVISEVEANLGSTPHTAGKFTITDASIPSGAKIIVTQRAGPYTGKGSRADEAEMDGIVAAGSVDVGGGSATVYWNSGTFVKGNVKFNYSYV